MPLFLQWIAAVGLLAEPADSSSRYQPLVAAFAATQDSQRGEWVAQFVLSRIRQASAVALSPENAALQKGFVTIVENRLRRGDQISEAGLLLLLRKLQSLERLAVNKLTTRYDEKLAQHFSQPLDRELRKLAWQKVKDAWTAAGEPAATEDQLIAWLDTAINRLDSNPTAKLPAIPSFSAPQIAATKSAAMPATSTTSAVKPPHVVQRPPSSDAQASPPRPKHPANTHTPATDPANVGVNVDELNTQIAGYNLAAASITAKLAATDDPSIDLLSEIVGELEELSQRCSALTLYVGLLDPAEAQLIGIPKPLDPIVTIVASRIFSLRQKIDGHRPGEAESARLRQRLAGLSKRLAQIAASSSGEDASLN